MMNKEWRVAGFPCQSCKLDNLEPTFQIQTSVDKVSAEREKFGKPSKVQRHASFL